MASTLRPSAGDLLQAQDPLQPDRGSPSTHHPHRPASGSNPGGGTPGFIHSARYLSSFASVCTSVKWVLTRTTYPPGLLLSG